MEREVFAEGDLIEALVNALNLTEEKDGAGFVTTAELVAATGWSVRRVCKNLNELKAAGQLELGTVYRLDLQDRRMPIRAYRFKQTGE